jgi:hypothetical protein
LRTAQQKAPSEAELADRHRFGGRRALGIALRAAALTRGGARGLAMLEESATVFAESPAMLECATSLIEWGAALRRSRQRTDALRVLSQSVDGYDTGPL